MHRFTTVVCLMAAVGPACLSLGQDGVDMPKKPAAPTLLAGMAAPEFKVEKFLKGAPFTSFEKGRVYVVEFWATWCGPCVMSMPHLSELQREYADKKVTICGVNVWQEPKYTEATLPAVMKFVEAKGAVMDYSVAYDGAAAFMAERWVKASGQPGIPCSFVVDRKGAVAWIGHPSSLDLVIEEVVKGTWDVATGPARVTAALNAFKDAEVKYRESVAAGDAAWDEATKRYPGLGRTRTVKRFEAMLWAGRFREACERGDRIVDEAAKSKNTGPIREILEALGGPAALKDAAAKKLLLKAAEANLALEDPGEAGPHVVMARAYFYNQEPEKGRAEAKRALELTAPASRASMEKWLDEIEEGAK